MEITQYPLVDNLTGERPIACDKNTVEFLYLELSKGFETDSGKWPNKNI